MKFQDGQLEPLASAMIVAFKLVSESVTWRIMIELGELPGSATAASVTCEPVPGPNSVSGLRLSFNLKSKSPFDLNR
jgi:hypothetical protein